MGQLDKKVAVVTGAARGIGRGVARRFAREGAWVIVTDVIRDEGERVAAEISAAGGTAEFVQCDVSRKDDVSALVDAAAASYGRLDVLVNCAIALSPHVGFDEKTRMMHDYVLRVGLYGTLWTMQAAFPLMREQRYGRIVNCDSFARTNGQPNTADYNSAKGAIGGLTRSAAAEWAEYGIRCNAIAPAALSMGFEKVLAETPGMAEAITAAPLGRVGDPESDIAPAALLLASDDSRLINGQTIYVDGGHFQLTTAAMFQHASAERIESWLSRPFNVQA